MQKTSRIIVVVTLLAWTISSHGFSADDVQAVEAWARATAPGQTVAGVYLQVTSNRDARLIGVTTTLTDAAELHFMSMKDGVMRMRHVDAIELPAEEKVSLQPGGYHVMLFGLPAPLKAGDQFPVQLLVQDESGTQHKVDVVVEVRNLDGSKTEHRR